MSETSVNYMRGDSFATFYSDDRTYVDRMRKRIAEYPDEIQIVQDDPEFGLGVRVPKSWFREPAPPRKSKPMSEERRQELADRLARARENKKNGG